MVLRPRTFRQADVTRALRGAKAAGIEILRVEIDRSGTITLVTNSERLTTAISELDNELAEFEARNGQG